MQIFVRGLGWNTYTIDIEPEDTVLTLKHRVQDRTGIRSTLQRLIFAGKQLEDKGPESLPHSSRRRNNTLADYKIRKESTVHLNMRMCHEVHVEWGVYGSMRLGWGGSGVRGAYLSYYREKVARACGIPSRHLRLCCKTRLFSDTQERGLLAIPWDWTARPAWRRAHFGEHGYFLTLMLHAVDARLGEPLRAARTPAPNPDTVAARIRKRRKTPAPDPNGVAARVRKRRRS